MRKIIISGLLFLTTLSLSAQRSEVGVFLGTSSYIGDLNPTKLFAAPQFGGGIIYRYNFNARWAFKTNILFASVEASDWSNNENYERNLSFRSPITEISAEVELNFFNIYNERGTNRFTPYIFSGFTIFSFNPQAEYKGKYYDLQHLGTEGQGLDGQPDYYSLTSCAIPFGIGFKLNIGRYISFGIEAGMRYTFTDYLDDVSKTYYDNEILLAERGEIVAALADRSAEKHQAGTGRGNVTTKDLYTFCGAMLTVKFGNEDKSCDLKKKRIKHKYKRPAKR
ncbi:DUF6089 family protein [Bacteroidales bacterium OttesenSCG-928-C03]|nr:DUF6089 family protein [Bacteroidales bacterium OttesenSCG-928-E04]MDL2309242.1 DUF6089 family protein [Bacteroidales bacterium OttesenSCG-928-C03]